MTSPARITQPLLDVIEVLLTAWQNDEEVHGWTIMKQAKRSGPTVYGVLDRLEGAEWISGYWEAQNPEVGRPPRRFYRLTPNGLASGQQLLIERRGARRGRAAGWKPVATLRSLGCRLADGETR
ncbi:PadR family transcriptional regulator [Micromonospora sp. NPDC005291]|uniref:PadR family transcriptional regulator n=1 Tax=Micromonospora sp. NPDC005291 TaxID=3156872 RepID=UPI00339FBA8B